MFFLKTKLEEAVKSSTLMLAEGAVIERLKRDADKGA